MSLKNDQSIHHLVQALSARRAGNSWLARCPAHDDRNPSLSIRESDGKILVHCHAGCKQRTVIAALRVRGLWKSQPQRLPRKARIVKTYDYKDDRGELL